MGIARDITKRKSIEESLKKSELLYRTLAENIPYCCLVLFKKDLEILFIGGGSPHMLFGDICDPKDAFWDIFEEDALVAMESGFRHALKGVKQSFEICHGPRYFDVFTLPIENNRGKVDMGMAMIHDITDRKGIEEELRLQKKELSDYAHIVAHNLKNQLITINAYAQLILDDDEDTKTFAKNLMKSVKRVNEYISGQLRLAEAGRNIGDLAEIDLNHVIDRIGKNFLIEIESENLPVMVGDPRNIEEVFINLVSNSLKHGRASKIYISSNSDDKWHRILFEDNGVGIDERILDKVFELGFSTDGSGFGLAIVKKIIDSHKGNIRVIQENGRGASFEISFPVGNS
jgi:signal transduction histidine kinase